MSKIKIMLSSPMANKTDDEINYERNEMANLLFDYYEDNCEIMSTVIENHTEKSALECLSESILFMSMTDVLEMEIDIRINEGRKYIEFDWNGLKEVVELEE